MIRECFKTNTGIMFDIEGLRALGMEPNALYPEVAPRPPPLSVNTLRIQDIPPPNPSAQHEVDLPNFAYVDDSSSALYMSEEEHELHDALSPVYDQLSLAPFWWVLELWPVKQRYQKSDDSWASYLGVNMGQGRIIPKQKHGVKVHRSVKMRMDTLHANGSKYVPKASFEKALAAGRVEWVD